ncbi:antibiotic biosynthesis monooxygenase family protein [Yoonia vestfoldensis]|uniref:antibiotic biosynthesis monooxygenase family protein n=1 Tax=Yoonia vestfoldensis TaxID=245188 RepID=UPI000477111E|nr:antibiotic biosynthesis monooxygenase family protein [Yoonia vestfoldensis]
MHALFFEMRPLPGHLDHYFAHVARLRPVLAQHTGLVFLDRYLSLTQPDLLLSHQLWDSEEAIVAWRKDRDHRRSQTAGRKVHFADYRIRVGARVLHRQAGHPVMPDETAAGDGAYVLALYGSKPVLSDGLHAFESVNHKDRFIALATYAGLADAQGALARYSDTPGLESVAIYHLRRDYGQFDRAQAPAADGA